MCNNTILFLSNRVALGTCLSREFFDPTVVVYVLPAAQLLELFTRRAQRSWSHGHASALLMSTAIH